jgi:hypothetical protein
MACFALIVASCSGGESIFDGAPDATSQPSGDTPTPSGDVDAAPTPDEQTEFNAFEFGLNYEFADEPIELTSNLGGADADAAATLHAELEAGGVDLTGMELWVFDVSGSDGRLLVIDVNRGSEQVPEESDSADIFEVLFAAPSFEESGITRFVLNFFGTDQDGGFVLTTTVDLNALLEASASQEEVDLTQLSDLAQFEIFRVPDAPPSSDTTTTTGVSTTTSSTAPGLIFADTFDTDTTVTPLFPPGVMSSSVTPEGTLSMSVFTTGVIPAMYPDQVPDGITISFDFNPMPNGSTASFGAVVLAESPADNALEHYVAVWANPSDGMLTIIPFDQAAGGWGTPTVVAIPASVGFGANGWHRMGLTLNDGALAVSINFVSVATWNGPTPVTSGYWGPVIIGAASGDAMLVDNVLVRVDE